MAYDGRIMRQALARFEEDKQRREADFNQRRRRLYDAEPRLHEIEQQLRATMPKLIASALRRGTDPLPAVRVLRDGGKACLPPVRRYRVSRRAGVPLPAGVL